MALPFREVVALTGPALPAVSLLGRLPAAMCPIGSLLLVNDRSGSISTAGLVAGALALGQALGGPLVGRLADRRGQRPVGLAAALANASAIALLVALSDGAAPVLAVVAFAAGLSVPQVGPLARSRLIALSRGRPRVTAAALSFDGTIDETGFVTGPALVGVLAAADPAAGLLLAASLGAVFGTLFALHPSARPGRPAPAPAPVPGRGRTARSPLLSPAICLLVAGMALQGTVFGAIQTGVTDLTESLGRPDAAGLVYALMGVPSALVGLLMTVRPARTGPRLRLRLVTAAQCAVALPLLAVDGLGTLSLAVTVLGLTYAPNIITMFALTERVAPPERMAEAMALLGSGIILGTSAGAMASGPIAETAGHAGAFALSCAAAGTSALIALLTASARRYPEPAPSARAGHHAAAPANDVASGS